MTRSELLERSIANARTAIFCQQHGDYEFPALQEVRQFTLNLLLAEQKRSEGCPYCKHHGEPSAVVWDTHKIKEIGENEPYKSFTSASMYTRKGEAELVILSQGADNKQNQIRILARHCLHCGRDLTEGESE